MTQIQLNGSPHDIVDGCTLEQLVRELTGADGHAPQEHSSLAPGIAVAVDETVVPRERWAEHVLAPETRVEVLTAVQGG